MDTPRDRFDFHAKYVFLTYPQCDIPAAAGLASLTALTGERAAYTIVSHEFHEDGGDHLHVLIVFRVGYLVESLCVIVTQSSILQRKFRTRNERYFDLDDGRGRRFHPNIQSARNAVEVYQYVIKDGDYLEAGTKPEKFVPPGVEKRSKRDAAFAALDEQYDTVEGFMSALRERHPYEFFTRGNTIKANLVETKRRDYSYQSPYASDSFVLPGAVQDWLDTEFTEEVSHLRADGRPPRPPSIFLLRGPYAGPC